MDVIVVDQVHIIYGYCGPGTYHICIVNQVRSKASDTHMEN